MWHQRKIQVASVNAAGGYVKWSPSAVIFQQKCGRWHFQIADGRDNPAKPRPVEPKNAVHRARYRNMPVSAVVGGNMPVSAIVGVSPLRLSAVSQRHSDMAAVLLICSNSYVRSNSYVCPSSHPGPFSYACPSSGGPWFRT